MAARRSGVNVTPRVVAASYQKGLYMSNDEIEYLFNQFWSAGMRKVKKKDTKKKFQILIKASSNPREFAYRIIEDIQARIKSSQFGFDRLHPLTYLNGERWEDEIINENKGVSNGWADDTSWLYPDGGNVQQEIQDYSHSKNGIQESSPRQLTGRAQGAGWLMEEDHFKTVNR